jgi:hypothetical protein
MHEMTHNRLLRLVVAMESALADGRYDEAANLRDEYRRELQQQAAAAELAAQAAAALQQTQQTQQQAQTNQPADKKAL